MRKISIVIWFIALWLALWLNVSWAQGGAEQWRPAVESACSSADCVSWMMSVIACESGGDPGAIGPNGEVGILQFHPQGLWGPVWDPYTQISIAAGAYYSGLRYHWVCSPW